MDRTELERTALGVLDQVAAGHVVYETVGIVEVQLPRAVWEGVQRILAQNTPPPVKSDLPPITGSGNLVMPK